jgi:hypothetical protein
MLDSVLQFVEQQWLYVIIALVAVILVIKIFKNVIRWLIILAIGAALVYFAMNYEDGKLLDTGKDLVQKATEYTKEQAVDGLMNEVKDARYTLNADGTYEVRTANFALKGAVASPDAVIVYKDKEFPVTVSGPLQQFIEQAKANSN